MPSLFDNTTFLEKVGLLLVIFALAALLILLVKWALAGRALSWNSLSVAAAKKNEGGDDIHADRGTIVDVFNQVINATYTVDFLKTKQVLSDQMYYLEDKHVIIQEALEQRYRTVLAEHLSTIEPLGPTTSTSHKEYLFFSSLITLMMESQKRSCRQIFIKNHFAHLPEKEFLAYLDEKTTLLRTKALQFVRDLYPSDKMIVSFESVESEVFGKATAVFDSNYEIAFRKAGSIYMARHEEADTVASGLKDYIKDSYGVDVGAAYKSIGDTAPRDRQRAEQR